MSEANFEQQLSKLKEKHYQNTAKQQRMHQEEIDEIHKEKMFYKVEYEQLLVDIRNSCVISFSLFFIIGIISAFKLISFLDYSNNNNHTLDATLIAVSILYYSAYKWAAYKFPKIVLWHNRYIIGAAIQGFLCSFIIITIAYATSSIDMPYWVHGVLILLTCFIAFIIRAMTDDH